MAKKFKKIQYFLGLVIGLQLSSTNSFANLEFDAHVHLNTLNKAKLTAEIGKYNKQYPAAQAMIISPSYLFYPDSHLIKTSYEKAQLKSIAIMNKTLDRHPNQFLGLCGISHEAPNILSYSEKCLSHKQVIGFKLRLASNYDLESYKSIYDRAFLKNQNKLKVLLVHIPGFAPDLSYYHDLHLENPNQMISESGKRPIAHYKKLYKESISFLSWIIKTAKTFPDTQIVLAHMAGELNGNTELIKILNLLIKKHKVDNIWLETSTSYFADFPDKDPIRNFGFDKILIGSDVGIGKMNFIPSFFSDQLEQDNSYYNELYNKAIWNTKSDRILSSEEIKLLKSASDSFLKRLK